MLSQLLRRRNLRLSLSKPPSLREFSRLTAWFLERTRCVWRGVAIPRTKLWGDRFGALVGGGVRKVRGRQPTRPYGRLRRATRIAACFPTTGQTVVNIWWISRFIPFVTTKARSYF